MPYNTEADIAAFVNTVWADAMVVARDNNIMTGLVTQFGDLTGLALRKNAKYGTAVFNQIAGRPVSRNLPQALTRPDPYEYGAQFFVTDSRLRNGHLRRAARRLANWCLVRAEDRHQPVGGFPASPLVRPAAGTDMSWANFFSAITKMRQTPAPVGFGLTPEQWHW
jgi:hypothetical protein